MLDSEKRKKTIFVVDDNAVNLTVAKRELEPYYNVRTVPGAAGMFKLAERIMPDLILLDVEMPEMDGYQALRLIKADPKLKDIPVIFLTAKSDAEAEVRGFELGAIDYVAKPFSAPVLLKRLEAQLDLDALIKDRTEKINRLHNVVLSSIADIVESRDKATGSHIERTQRYLELLIGAMQKQDCYAEQLDKWDMFIAVQSAQLHDLGKINVPDAILNKPGKLTEEEFSVIKTHSAVGERIINGMIDKLYDDDFLVHAKLFAGSHHEKWDGSGYPCGLCGNDIPLQGRLMAIADVYDALVSERPYKKAFSHETAVQIITKNSGTHFDPKIVEVFLSVADEHKSVLEEYLKNN